MHKDHADGSSRIERSSLNSTRHHRERSIETEARARIEKLKPLYVEHCWAVKHVAGAQLRHDLTPR